MIKMIVTCLGAGLLRPAPGTWGTLAGMVLLYLAHITLGFWGVAIGTVLIFALGWWATAAYTAGGDNHDPSEVVIDEVAGVWLTLWPVSYGAASNGVDVLALYPGWIVAFFAFRFFDILKPGPVGWADRRNDPLGVMLDDILAGVFAALTVVAFGAIYHIWLV